MAIISFDRDAVVDYVPEYANNRCSSDPCVVRLRFVPYSRIQVYSRLLATKRKGLEDTEKLAEAAQFVQRKQFVDNVDDVSGYYVSGREVSDPEEFYDTADTDLILEIVKAMESMSKLSDGQRKN